MTKRREVERALMWSNIRPLARFIVLAVATKADANSGIVPAEHSPSLTTLQDMTGLAKSQIVKELDYAEGLGWVKRARPQKPSRVARTSYAIDIGSDDPERPTSPHHGRDDETETVRAAETDEPVRTTDGSAPPDEVRPVRTTDRSLKGAFEETAGRRQSAPRTSPPHGPALRTTTTSKPKNSRPRVDNDRPDVVEICTYLADSIESLGFQRPKITKDWLVNGRLLLDAKRRWRPDVARVKAAIDWVHDNGFWYKNILSMPTLRAKWDRISADRIDEKRAVGAGPPRRGEPATPSAPPKVPAAEQCPDHPGRRRQHCGLCRAADLGARPPDHERSAT